ncbi:hypothetical protein JHK86_016332 [Glycine max]|nr:hypothetical protein JHK86_016332 [Glycine max]
MRLQRTDLYEVPTLTRTSRHGHVDICQTHQTQPGHGHRCRVGVGIVSDTGHDKRLECPCFIGRSFGHFARVLVDLDLTWKLHSEFLVE